MWTSTVALSIFLPIIGYYLYKLYKWKRRLDIVCRALEVFPWPVNEFHWFLGHLPFHPGPNEKGLMKNVEWYDAHPRYYLFYIGAFRPHVHLTHPETIKQLLKTAQPKPTSFGGAYRLLLDWIGYGLLLSSGQYWYRHRKLLTPAFHFDVLKSYLTIFNKSSDRLVEKLRDLGDNGGKSVEIFDAITLHTLEIIMKCSFSMDQDLQRQQKGSNQYVEATLAMSSLFIERIIRPHLHLDFLYRLTSNGRKFKKYCNLSHNVAMELITKRRKYLMEQGKKAFIEGRKVKDFLDIMLLAKDMDGNTLTDQEIRDEVETFMFEGHDTTKSAISFLLYNLAKHKEAQIQAREEVDRILAGRDSDDLFYEDISEMNYVTKCIKETLRMFPPVHTIVREIDEELAVDDKKVYPGSWVTVSIFALHHSKEVWGEDTFAFDPERFNESRLAEMDPYAFIPFSAGPRNCIGQNFAMNEMKVTTAKIVHHFELFLDESVPFELLPEIVLKTVHGANIYFIPRHMKMG